MSAIIDRIPWRTWQPKLFQDVATYDRRALIADVIAGLTVGVVALPLAMAFGIASGVTPQAGIYTAIVGGFVVSLLGGSRIQIGGPTGAFVVIVAGIVAAHGLPGLLMVTMMAGVILLFLAVTGLGQAIKFIPRPVVLGFTNGIALLIASTQIKDFFGLGIGDPPSEFFARMKLFVESMNTFHPAALALGVGSLALVLLVPRWLPRIPGSIVALVLGTVAVVVFQLPVDTIGSKFGAIPSGLPPIHIPAFRADLILPLLPAAMTVALLAAVESLLSAVVADSMTGDRHNSNAELMAQGVANIVAPLVGGIPVTGAIARTATNFRSGARSPVAGLVHAATLLAIVLLLAPLATYVPLATLAAVLFVVAYNMGEWREIGGIWRLDWADKSVWMITFALTVMADLTIAVEVGMALAALLYIYRVTDTTSIATVTPEYIEDGRAHVLQDKHVPSYRHDPAHPRAVSVRDDGQARGRDRRPVEVRAHRHPPVAEHDGDRRLGPACAGDAKRSPEEIRPHADPLRRAPPARAVPPPGRARRTMSAPTTSCLTSRRRWRGRRKSIRASRWWARTPRAISQHFTLGVLHW